MTTCPLNCGNCCPEAPDITVNDVLIEVGDLVAKFYQDKNLSPVAGTTNTVQLTATPIASLSIHWYIDGLHQDADHVTGSGKTWVFDEDISARNVTAMYVGLVDSADAESEMTTGSIKIWSGSVTVEDGWLECDGSDVNIEDYPALWAVYGTDFGGDGVTDFGLPPAAAPAAGLIIVCKT